MKPIHIYRHVDCEGPGFLQTLLDEKALPYKIIAIDAGETVESDLSTLSALVFMGGNMSVNDELPWIQQSLNLIREARQKNIPMLGHCLGGQLISKALGATVGPNEAAEIGWHEVSQSNSGHELLSLLPQSFLGFHWHRETFSLPEHSTPILQSQLCPRQGYVLENVIALQTHIEMTEDMVRTWVQTFPEDLTGATPGEQTAQQVLEDLPQRINALNQTARKLYDYWLAQI